MEVDSYEINSLLFAKVSAKWTEGGQLRFRHEGSIHISRRSNYRQQRT